MTSRRSGKQYRNPPLQEAICEIYFDAKEPLDEKRFESLRFDWRDQGFGDQRFVDQKQVNVRLSIQGLETKEIPSDRKLVCRSDDGSQLIQLTRNMLVVNHLAPYPGWADVFRPIVLQRVAELQTAVPLNGVKRVGLRYIDRIDIPQAPLEWSDWFNLDFPVPAALKRPGSRLQMRVESPLEEDLKGIVQIFSAPERKRGHSSVIFDMDVISSRYLALNEIEVELERVHEPQTLAFEEILTDNLRNLFDSDS